MKVLVTQEDYGRYENERGERFNVIACTWVKGQRSKDFLDFDTLEDALEFYNLKEVENGSRHN